MTWSLLLLLSIFPVIVQPIPFLKSLLLDYSSPHLMACHRTTPRSSPTPWCWLTCAASTHGLNRLPGYLARIRSGALNPSPELRFDQRSPVCALLDAQHTFGFLAAHTAVERALAMAATSSVGIVAVKNSGHYGMAATYLLQAIEKGYGAMAFTNASRSMPAWGSREPLLGTSPFAVGLPGGSKGHFVLEMSPAVVARVRMKISYTSTSTYTHIVVILYLSFPFIYF